MHSSGKFLFSNLLTVLNNIQLFRNIFVCYIVQTKKRYVGYKYESVNQKEPVYEAKGIETVRRDGCPAVVKVKLFFKLCVLIIKLNLKKIYFKSISYLSVHYVCSLNRATSVK
jgi:hypothetical protein